MALNDKRQHNTDSGLIVTTTTTTSYSAVFSTLASTTPSAPTGAVDGRSSFSSTLASVVAASPSAVQQQPSSTSSAGGPPPGTVGTNGTGWRVGLGVGLGLGILALFLIGMTAVWLARWHWSGRRKHDQAAARAPPALGMVGGSSEVILTGAGVFPDLDDEKGEKGGWKSFGLFRKKSGEKDYLRPEVDALPTPPAPAFRHDNRFRAISPEPTTYINATRLGGINPTLAPVAQSPSATRLDAMAPSNGRSTPLEHAARATHARDVSATAVQTPPGLYRQHSEDNMAAASAPREWPLSMDLADQMSPATDSSEARLFRRFDTAVANAPPAFHGTTPRSHPRASPGPGGKARAPPPPQPHPEPPHNNPHDDSRSRSASPSNLSVPARPSTSPAYPIYAEIQRLQQQRWLVDEREQIGAEYDRLMRARNQERLRVLRWAQGGPANNPGQPPPPQQQGQHLQGPGSVGAARKAAAAMSARMSESSDR